MLQNNRDFLFLFDATNTNPNGDPDQENRPRFDNDTKALLVSDVRRKRDIRDFLANKGWEIFVRTLDEQKINMETMLGEVLQRYDVAADATQEEKINLILDHMIDIRMFGSAMAVGKMTRTFTGPIQITWGYSLHPVDIVKSSSIVTIMNDDNSTFGKMYKAHYALVAHSGSMNKFAAAKTRLSEDDADLMPRALVQSMMNNLTHSKQGQRPLLYLEIIYNKDFDGYLGDLRRFLQVTIKNENCVRSLNDWTVDFAPLVNAVKDLQAKNYPCIDGIRLWQNAPAGNFINLPSAEKLDLLRPIAG